MLGDLEGRIASLHGQANSLLLHRTPEWKARVKRPALIYIPKHAILPSLPPLCYNISMYYIS